MFLVPRGSGISSGLRVRQMDRAEPGLRRGDRVALGSVIGLHGALQYTKIGVVGGLRLDWRGARNGPARDRALGVGELVLQDNVDSDLGPLLHDGVVLAP